MEVECLEKEQEEEEEEEEEVSLLDSEANLARKMQTKTSLGHPAHLDLTNRVQVSSVFGLMT